MESFSMTLTFSEENFYPRSVKNSFYDDIQPWERVDVMGFTQPAPPNRNVLKKDLR